MQPNKKNTPRILHVELLVKIRREDGFNIFYTAANEALRTRETQGIAFLATLAGTALLRDWLAVPEPTVEPTHGLVRVQEESLCLPLLFRGVEMLVPLTKEWMTAIAPLASRSLELANKEPMRTFDVLPGKDGKPHVPQLAASGF